MSKRKALAIVNPVARHGHGRELAAPALEILADAFDLEVAETAYTGHARDLATQVEDGIDIFAVGGDGTTHEVVNGILDARKKDAVFAPIPTGSGNDSARSLGLPLDPVGAAREVARQRVREVDVGQMNDHWYSNSLGLGMDARVAWEAHHLRESSTLKGVPLYLKALGNVLSDWQTYDLEIETDGQRYRAQTTILAINIGRTYGGGFHVTPHAYIDDGFFDCCLFEAIAAVEVWFRIPFLIPGKHEWMKKAHIFRARSLAVRSTPEALVQLDGEVYRVSEAEVRLHERALKAYAGERGFFVDTATDRDPVLELPAFALHRFRVGAGR